MSNVRRAKPRHMPSTLSELVRDIDERLEGGDALSDVWVDHEDWTNLVLRAEEEQERGDHAVTFQRDRADSLAELLNKARAERDALVRDLSNALGWGPLSGVAELLQVARGYVMALEAELEQAGAGQRVARAANITGADRQSGELPPTDTKASCKWCDEEGHTEDECALAPSTPIDDEPEEVGPTILETAEKNQAEEDAQETYCRSCRKWFKRGTHAAHTKAKPAQAELPRS